MKNKEIQITTYKELMDKIPSIGILANNKNLAQARVNKNDEFYTHYGDIEKEVANYKEHFKGKKVLLNCDNYKESKFYTYFKENFRELGLVKLVTTHKDEQDFICSTIFMNEQEEIYILIKIKKVVLRAL